VVSSPVQGDEGDKVGHSPTANTKSVDDAKNFFAGKGGGNRDNMQYSTAHTKFIDDAKDCFVGKGAGKSDHVQSSTALTKSAHDAKDYPTGKGNDNAKAHAKSIDGATDRFAGKGSDNSVHKPSSEDAAPPDFPKGDADVHNFKGGGGANVPSGQQLMENSLQKDWPDLLAASKVQSRGTSRLRRQQPSIPRGGAQRRTCSVSGRPPGATRSMQPRRDPMAIIWTCSDCKARFDRQEDLIDHVDAEGHWSATLDMGRTFVRKAELNRLSLQGSEPDASTPRVDAEDEVAKVASTPAGCQLFSMSANDDSNVKLCAVSGPGTT